MPLKPKCLIFKKICELFLLIVLLLYRTFPFSADFWLGHILDVIYVAHLNITPLSWLSQTANI